MRTTEGTTPAPSSARILPDQLADLTAQVRELEDQVKALEEELDDDPLHYYWVSDPRALNLCGARSNTARPKRDRVVESVGGMMAVKEPRDCPACVTIVEQRWELDRLRRALSRRLP